ncbi:MAG TPA: ATP-dependent helicase HrpB [Rhizobiaceae bacterium]|nr:ATP-dependent helicase HrpB [Rhizobiaceae bacterium]
MPLPTDLPVNDVLSELSAALEDRGSAVLVAPPGAGKTTLVPLALLESNWIGKGRIVLLEPRRLAARAAARRMASLVGEAPGGRVGYAMRMESRVSDRTRILVATEGILSRMILDDPELQGISAVIFDEFHERSLDADFGLALALDIRSALRPDLRLLVMSATLDGARVAALLKDAPVIESSGRSFPITICYEERSPGQPVEQAVASAVRRWLSAEEGSILAFLPGQREILRTAEMLDGSVPDNIDVVPLYGALDGKAQDLAIRPAAPGRRKVVLATSVAETSITIDGVRIVIDSGLARQPRYEPSSGLTRLETVRLSRASADQRAGRAGRTEPGVAVRLWRAEQTNALLPFSPPEIVEADLAGLVLDCAAFGVTDPSRLAFLDQPPEPALAEARQLLRSLDAIDEDGRITEAGLGMRRLALPARLAHMVVEGARKGSARGAAELAVLLTERGLGGDAVDLETRLSRFRNDRSPRATAARKLAAGLARTSGRQTNSDTGSPTGALLLHAWPDRVAIARGAPGRYLLANGSGAVLDETDALARHKFLVVADLRGGAQNARIASAASVTEDEIRQVLAKHIERRTETGFDTEKKAVRRREILRLGALVLSQRSLPPPSGEEADRAIIEIVLKHGLDLLPWGEGASTLRQRLAWLHAALGGPWPDVSDEALLADLDQWLRPFLAGEASLTKITAERVREALYSRIPHALQRQSDRLAPTHFDAPSGSHIPIRYEGQEPVLAIRVQELFGMDRHPAIGDGKIPLTLELLSPAHRPIQTTRDLPGFWRGSWSEVRAAMRGRYPKHPWPENPLEAQATSRAKPRK